MLATAQAIEFESAFADVAKVVDFPTPEAPRALQNDLLALSSEMPVTAEGLTDIAAKAGSAGIAFAELTDFAEDAAQVAVAFDITAARAGDGLAVLRNVFGLTQDGVFALAGSINHLSNSMQSEAPEILDVLLRVGATGRTIGMAGEQVAALGSAMLSTGTAPEVVSTGLNALIMRLATATHQSKDFTTALEGIGLKAPALEAAVRRDASGAILGFLETVQGSKDSLGVLSELFGAEYADDIAKLVNNIDQVRLGFQLVANPVQYASSVTEEYGVRAATTANQVQMFQNRIRNVGTLIGQVFLPPFNAALGVLSGLVLSTQRFVQEYPMVGGVLVGGLAVIGASIALLGLLVLAIGAVGFASAQLRIGMTALQT
ncbi:MAG: phage tail tape measure protein [Pleurocapsa sp. SU_196_0]|nr:phage tail tape measure protein [Pleurocapsa sp. SU_196_0]